MAFAIFYNQTDLQVLADYIGNPLSFIASQRAEAAAYIAAGLGDWHMAPFAPPDRDGPPTGDARILVLSGTYNDEPLTLARFVQLCRLVAERGGSVPAAYGGGPEYLSALADDMASTGVENWQG